jgi:catechol 2,3-dioxygenase-like lactoylglutathione lyase family enzyme
MLTMHHIAFTATDLTRSGAFYDAVLGVLGYAREHTSNNLIIWKGPGPEILLYPVDGDDRAPHTHGRPGLQHLALRADDPATVDAVHDAAHADGVVVHPPRQYPEYPFASYYAVFVTDPDGIRLEVVHLVAASH